jgi:glycosyltransferase involved in cell wall biosynthesis
VVVDDGSPEPLDAVVASFTDRIDVRLVVQQHSGPGPARNAGARSARGRYLAFLDDDCAPAPDWLTALAQELVYNDRRLLGGRVENALSANPFAAASQHIARYVYQHNQSAHAREPFFTTNNMALSRDRFHEVGGFTTEIPSATAEDKEFCDRWRARGFLLVHLPTAVVHHSHDLTFARFLGQHFNYGRGILAFRLIRRRRVQGRIVSESLSFYAGLLMSPLRERRGEGRWSMAALVFLSQVATVAGALAEAVAWPFRKRGRVTPLARCL